VTPVSGPALEAVAGSAEGLATALGLLLLVFPVFAALTGTGSP
jgi:hypothetical protein